MKRRDYQLGLLHAARIASRIGREMRVGLTANSEIIGKMRRAGKNMRSGENGAAFQHHNRLGGYFLDKALTAENIAREIREAARRLP